MSNKDIRLELKIWGSVLDCRVYLNENEIGNWGYDRKNKVRFKELRSFPVEDTLDVETVAKGKNGSSVTLEVMIEGQDGEQLECVVEDGMTKTYKSIVIQ